MNGAKWITQKRVVREADRAKGKEERRIAFDGKIEAKKNRRLGKAPVK
jgi:hypothetical protein